ncbi:hypothetical protein H4R33_004285 [Dimargaris cristalligena]|nr:hypothetical protein H4R33_004285 [Dimargaris cristalligena]
MTPDSSNLVTSPAPPKLVQPTQPIDRENEPPTGLSSPTKPPATHPWASRDRRRERLERKRRAAYASVAKVENLPDCSTLFTPKPTPILCLVNVGYGGITGVTIEQLEGVLVPCPGFVQVVMNHGKPYTFVIFSDAQTAATACASLHEQPSELLLKRTLFAEHIPLKITSFTMPLRTQIEQILNCRNSPNPIVTLETDHTMHVQFPATASLRSLYERLQAKGLYCFDDFVTPEEEQEILGQADEHDFESWIEVNGRYVQHYGHIFDYKTKQVGNPDAAIDRQFPGIIQNILQRLYQLPIFTPANDSPAPSPDALNHTGTRLPLRLPQLNQLTISKYPIGSGISFHSDSHVSFTDVLVVVSLASPITMEFRSPFYAMRDQLHSRDAALQPIPTGSGGGGGSVPPGDPQPILPNPVFIDLAPRSLTVMSGEIRYGWEHSIRARKSDLLFASGAIRPRQFRVSLTVREVSEHRTCTCPWAELCDRSTETTE